VKKKLFCAYFNRYMHGRGNTKRHTLALGSAEEVQEAQRKMVQQQQQQQQQQQPMRTRRTGLHTVMERPPGKQLFFFKSCT
jgi:predicted alpha/beta superfamily hydrolase